MKINSGILFFFVLIVFSIQEISYSQVPYVPTPESVVEGMLAVAKVNNKDMVYDLGCGDGRIVVTAAKKYGARGVGIDNNPERIKDSWANAKQNGLSKPQVDFREQNLFDTNLRDATVVTLYLLSEINLKLRPKLFKELKPGTRVVSHSFSMDTWEPDSLLDVDGRNVYFWKIPANASGTWELTLKEGKNDKYQLQIDQAFQRVDGSVQMGNQKFYLASAKLDGDRLTFSVNKDKSAQTGNMKFTMKIKDDQMEGTINSGEGTKNFTAKRKSGTMKPLDPQMSSAGK